MSPRVAKVEEGAAPAKPRWRRRKRAVTEALTWVVWPARTHLLIGLLVLAFIAGVSVCVYLSMDSRVYAGIAFFTLIVAVSPYFLPTSYSVDETGVTVDSMLGRRTKLWGTLKVHFHDGDRGVLLSPVSRFGTLARTRGIYLPFQGNKEQVLAVVEKHLAEGAQ